MISVENELVFSRYLNVEIQDFSHQCQSNVPHLTDLKTLDMRYIIGAKPGDHKFLFNLVDAAQCTEYSHQTDDGTTHRYRYINQIQLNKSHPDFSINFLEYWETKKNGDKQHFS